MPDDDDEHLSPLNHAVVEMVKRRMREVSAEMEAEGTVSRRDAGPVLRDVAAKTNPTAPAPSTGNEAIAACPPAHRDAPARSPVHPDEKAQYAKRSQPAVPFHTTELAHAGVITPRKIRAARLLLVGGRVGEVAAAVGVSRHTITRWVKDPAFQAEARRQVSLSVPLAATRTVRH